VEQQPANLKRTGRGPTWAEFDAVVADRDALAVQVATLMAQMTTLVARVAELESLRKQNSGNSSKPPSSDGPAHKTPRTNKPTGNKAGGQAGHEGKTATPFAAEATTPQPVVPVECGHCGGGFAADVPCTSPPFLFQHIEIPPLPPLVVEYQLHERCCAACGGTTRGDLPGDVGPSRYGPRLMALVASWAIQFHLSRRQIQRLLASQFGLTMSTGTVQAIIEQVAEACNKPVEDLKTAINNAPSANADETGHAHQGGGAKGKRHWLWVAVTLWGALYATAVDRGAAGLALILNKDYAGIVGCDRWRPYESCFGENRQLCWAHLKRDGQSAVDRAAVMLKSKDEAVRVRGEALRVWGEAFLATYEAMFKSWKRFQVGEYSRSGLRGAMVVHQTTFRTLFEQNRAHEDLRVRRLCKDLRRPVQWKALWTFVTTEGVEPTNNRAEQAMRQPVLLRKKSGGTRSQIGMQALATLLSVVETCRRQSRSAIDYFEAVIRSQRLGQPPPSLVPA
jgi:transposase